MCGQFDGIGIKRLGTFTGKVKKTVEDAESEVSKHDLYSELSIELDGITELTKIDPTKFLALVRENNNDYKSMVDKYRKKILDEVGLGMNKQIVDSILDAMISLDLLKSYIFRAGGYNTATKYICKKYGVEESRIALRSDPELFSVVQLKKNHEIKEASHVITSHYGSKVADELYSIFMIAQVGKLLAVKDGAGRIVGVVEFLYDRCGATYVHPYCILKNFRGYGVGLKLLDAVEKYAFTNVIWSTRSLDMLINIHHMTLKGYVGTVYINDYWGDGTSKVVFEKDMKNPVKLECINPVAIHSLSEFASAGSSITILASREDLLEKALNENKYVIVSVSDGVEKTFFNLVKMEGLTLFEQRKTELTMPNYSGQKVKPFLISTNQDINEAIGLEDSVFAELREDYSTLKMLTYVGLIAGFRDSGGELIAFTCMFWGNDKSILTHATTLSKKYSKKIMLSTVVNFIEDFARANDIKFLNHMYSMEDMQSLAHVINEHGFVGKMLHMNPYSNGVNYMYVEKEIDESLIPKKNECENPSLIRGILELKPEMKCISIYSRNYMLNELVLSQGYVLTKVAESDGKTPDLFIFCQNTTDGSKISGF